MAVTDPLFAEFPPVSTADWQATIEKDLKGKDPSTLLWKTEDGITVKPFYRTEDVPEPVAVPLPPKPGWRVCYEVSAPQPREANAVARRALESGAQEIAFRGVRLESAADVRELLAGIDAPVHFSCGAHVPRLLVEAGVAGLRGSQAAAVEDPEAVRELLRTNPEFAVLAVPAEQFHRWGATAVEELAFAISSGVEHLAAFGPEAAAAVAFHFAIGPNYFFEIAKLRAARLLWQQAQEAFGAEAAMKVYARTSEWNQTIYDAYNNLLRGTTEAMSAALGGADVITVVPFDEPYRNADDFSRHLALNTQLILRDEAHFGKVADPAAGSWYIDSLTLSIAHEAWKLFQQVEAEGGFRAAVQSGFVERTISKSRDARNQLVAQRRRIFVGTNQYPNLRETVLDHIEKEPKPWRGPYPFEALRLATERYGKKAGRVPNVLLLTLGDLKMRRARADFITNFFGVGGFAISEPPAFPNAEAAGEYAAQAKADLVVLCSSDPEYPAVAGPVIETLRAAGVQTPVLVAGYPQDSLEALKAAGVEDFIHVKSNPIQTISAWQKRLGVNE